MAQGWLRGGRGIISDEDNGVRKGRATVDRVGHGMGVVRGAGYCGGGGLNHRKQAFTADVELLLG